MPIRSLDCPACDQSGTNGDTGSNVDEVIDDLLAAIKVEDLGVLQRFHDPNAAIRMALAGELAAHPGSPAANELIRAARNFLATNPDHLSG